MKHAAKLFVLGLLTLIVLPQVNAQQPCDRLTEIKIMPFHDERVDDAAYYSIIEAGESALPCLIGKITDTRKMRDPRQAPGYAGIEIRVGDVAYFMLHRIAKFDFMETFPTRVQERYKIDGVFAYFVFVQKTQNRFWLQRKLKNWYRKRDSKSAA